MKNLAKLISVLGLVLTLGAGPAWCDETVADGLTLKVPSAGQRNWNDLFLNFFAKPISGHDHTGGGKGTPIGSNAIQANAITGAKVRWANDEYLRARNALNSADLNLIKADSSDTLRFSSVGANSRADLGLAIGTNVQAYDADLTTLGAGGSAARAFLGFGSGTPSNGQLNIGNGSSFSLATLTGTTDQVTVTNGSGTITLSLPQSINSTSSPTFTALTLSDDLVTSKSAAVIHPNTSDAGDTKSVAINGGGANTAARGAGLTLWGNEGSSAGQALLRSGDGQAITIETPSGGAAGSIVRKTDGLTRWTTDGSGNENGDETNGGDIVINRTGKYLKYAAIQSWSPTVTGQGTIVTSGNSFPYAVYDRAGAWINFQISATGTIASGSGTALYVTVPVAGAASSFSAGVCYLQAVGGNSVNMAFWQYDQANSRIAISPSGGGSLTAGSYIFFIDGKYRAV